MPLKMKTTYRIGTRTRAAGPRCQRGITLLESLVSVVILAVAVLGMLGVQLRTLAETQTGVRRAQAVRLIEDFAERVKTNADRSNQLGSYVSTWTNVPTGTNCLTAGCSSTQLAAWDVQQWKQSVADALPNGQASIFLSTSEAVDPGNRRQLGIMVGWRTNERRSNDTKYLDSFDVSTGSPATCPVGLICHVVYVQP